MKSEELTDSEKEFLSIAIIGLCMRQGHITFQTAIDIGEKLKLGNEIVAKLESWIAYSELIK